MNVGLLLMLLLEGIPPPAGMGGQARHLIQQAYQAELDVIAEVAAPKDREILAKQRSSHWAKMLFSSRIYFDGSMSNLFRMDSSTIDALIRTVTPHLTTGRMAPDAVLPPVRVAVFLYLCAQGTSLEATADRFAIGPSTVSGIVREVSSIVCQELTDLVAFPPLVQCASHFTELCGVPQIVGCIDGSHIPIARPSDDGDMYYNRKCWYSVVLQAVVDWRGRFCDLDCKWPGRVGDSRVFRNSTLGRVFPSVSAAAASVAIPTGDDTHVNLPPFLLGDSGYQNTNFLVTTFELAETEDELCKDLNEHLTRARYRVECAFGQLKCRWRILLRGVDLDTEIAPDIVYALCIIQNFLMDYSDTVAIDEEEVKSVLQEYERKFPQPQTELEPAMTNNLREKLKRWWAFRRS